MKMPVKKSIKRFLIASILVGVSLPVIVVGGKKIFFYWSEQMHTFFTPEEVSITMIGPENSDLISKINYFTQQQIIKKSLLTTSPEILVALLQKTFPAIKKITYEYQPPKTILFTVEGTKPTCLVNGNFVIGDQPKLLNKTDFNANSLTNLPSITIDKRWLTDNLVRPSLYSLINRLTTKQWTTFAISYHAPWLLELAPYKSVCKTAILATEHSLFETKKFDAISSIFQDLCARGIITKKVLEAKNCSLLFDTRIKDQIIVRCNQPAKRGRGHG